MSLPLGSKEETMAVTESRAYIRDQAELLDSLMAEVLPKVKTYLLENADADATKVVDFYPPKELLELIKVQLPKQASSKETVLAAIDQLLQYSVRTGHPRFYDKLFAGSDATGQVAEFLTAVLNSNVHTYAVSPVFSVLEAEVNKAMARAFTMDPAKTEGCLTPGASFANLMAVVAARHKHFPHIRQKGLQPGDRPVILTSAQAHYSVRRAAMMLGMGMDAVIPVEADIHGRMKMDALQAAIALALKEKKTPFFVSSTAGTTVMGGFENFRRLREICDEHKLWLHVDAAWGTAGTFSKERDAFLMGAEKADSLAWDAHKGMGIPIFASGVLTNGHIGLLREANNSAAEYLFHEQAAGYDLGDYSLQCGRRADGVKIWLSWLAQGTNGFQKRIDHALEIARYLAHKLSKDDRFICVTQPQYTNVCFWYLPPALRGLARQDVRTKSEELAKTTKVIYSKMQAAGTMLINFNPMSDHALPHFFRFVAVQPQADKVDMDFILEEMDRLGKDLDLITLEE